MRIRTVPTHVKSSLAAIAAFGALMSPATANAQDSLYMVEVLTLKSGATVEEAHEYFKAVYPVIASHGFFPVKAYDVKQDGSDGDSQIVQIWRVENPNAIPEIMSDPKYQNHVETRDSIFDLKNGRTGFMGHEIY